MKYTYLLPIPTCLLIGILFYLFQHDWIVYMPGHATQRRDKELAAVTSTRKQVVLRFWAHDTWHTESTELVWSTDSAQTLLYIINSWLTLIEQEGVSHKKVTAQSVLLSTSGQLAYLSFDGNPFHKQASVYEKLMWTQGLLSTISLNKIPIHHVQFLMHHQPLIDNHLDFSNPWPLSGFVL